ncbi:MAG: hypothetical protein LBF85_02265 [Tannerella sp.]|jgi:hypothetical protein|nr:hypothetical protein [Tannerella sp.]
MSNKQDWLPKNHEKLYDQSGQTILYLSVQANATRMSLDGFATWLKATLQPAYDTFTTAFEDWKNPAERTPAKTATLTDAENVFIPLYRHLYTGMLKDNPLVTDTDLVAMGLPQRSNGERHPAKIPTTTVALTVKAVSPGVVEAHLRDSSIDNPSRAKPEDVHGAEVVTAVLDTPPVDWSELKDSHFTTTSTIRLAFQGKDRRKHLFIAARRENTRGQKEPWGDIQDTIIP